MHHRTTEQDAPLIGQASIENAAPKKALNAHVWALEANSHYVEEEWCNRRLFEVEKFSGNIFDPCCGWGRIPIAAKAAGYGFRAGDLVDRGFEHMTHDGDFLAMTELPAPNVVCNPPFHICREFAEHALKLGAEKIAMIWLWRRVPAAHWLSQTPLARIWPMNPRPSMPPGSAIAAGQKVGGGTQDFCWLVWERGYTGQPVTQWLRRDA